MAIVHINRTYAHYLLIENVLAQSTELPLDLQQRQKYEIIIVKLQSVYRGGSTDLDWIVSSCGNFPRLLFFAPRTKCTRLRNANTIRCASGENSENVHSSLAARHVRWCGLWKNAGLFTVFITFWRATVNGCRKAINVFRRTICP